MSVDVLTVDFSHFLVFFLAAVLLYRTVVWLLSAPRATNNNDDVTPKWKAPPVESLAEDKIVGRVSALFVYPIKVFIDAYLCGRGLAMLTSRFFLPSSFFHG